MATFNLSTGVPILRSDSARVSDRLASCRTVADAFALEPKNGRMCLQSKQISPIRCRSIAEQREVESCDGSLDTVSLFTFLPFCLFSRYLHFGSLRLVLG